MNHIRSKPVNYRYLIAIILSVVSVNAFTVYFINQERYIYNWDMLAYWEPYLEIGRSLLVSPLSTIKSILLTVRYSDYNDLPVLPLLPFYYIFGETRLGYILAISNMYLLPSILILTYVSERIASSYRHGVDLTVFSLIFVTILIFGPLWIPTMRGYPDIMGVIFIGLVFLIYMNTPLEKQNLVLLLLTAVFLFIMGISRRYFNFWVEGFFVAAFLERFSSMLLSGTRNYKQYFDLIRNLLIIAAICIVLVVVVLGPMIKRQLTTDWAEIYGAYQQSSSWIERCLEFPKHFGLLYSALAGAGLVISIWTKQIRHFAVFLTLQTIVTVIAFTRVQSFDEHQYLLICPPFLIFTAVFLDRTVYFLRNPLPRLVFIVLYLVFIVSMFADSLVPNFTVPGRIAFLYPPEQYKPLVRDDLEEVNRLLEYMEKLSADKPGSAFYLLSSSALWNSSILRTAVMEKYKDPDTMPNINTTSDVDRRDGFPLQFFTSEYLIIAEPLQYHLGKKDQRVITLPAEEVLKREGIGSNYKELPEKFDLDKGVKLYVYERERPPDYASVRSTLNDFLAYYPEMAERYRVLPLELFAAGGDGAGENANVKYLPGKTVSFNTGGSVPAEAYFRFNGDLMSISITPSLGDDCGSRSRAELSLTGDGKEIFRRAVLTGDAESYDIDLAGVDFLRISAINAGPEPCDVLNITVVSQDWKTE